MKPDALCGLLAERERLVTFAAVVLGAATPNEVVERTGLSARDAVSAIRRLTDGGLLMDAEGKLVADTDIFKEAVREYGVSAPPEAEEPGSRVLRNFIRDGRLVQIPAAHSKRRLVLEHIAMCFEPGVKYPERAVDTVLRAWHEDYASLRRYLIDEELMARTDGIYWRTGGPV